METRTLATYDSKCKLIRISLYERDSETGDWFITDDAYAEEAVSLHDALDQLRDMYYVPVAVEKTFDHVFHISLNEDAIPYD